MERPLEAELLDAELAAVARQRHVGNVVIARAQRIADTPSDEDHYTLWRLRGLVREAHDRLRLAFELRDRGRIAALMAEMAEIKAEVLAVNTWAGQRMNQLDQET